MHEMTVSRSAMIALTVLRVVVGWHFLYEGIAKLTLPAWTAAGYLKQARGPFAEWDDRRRGRFPVDPARCEDDHDARFGDVLHVNRKLANVR